MRKGYRTFCALLGALSLCAPAGASAQALAAPAAGFIMPVLQRDASGMYLTQWQRGGGEFVFVANAKQLPTDPSAAQFKGLSYTLIDAKPLSGCARVSASLNNFKLGDHLYFHDVEFGNDSGAFVLRYARIGSDAFPADVQAFFAQLCSQPSLQQYTPAGSSVAMTREQLNGYAPPDGWSALLPAEAAFGTNHIWTRKASGIRFIEFDQPLASFSSEAGLEQWLTQGPPGRQMTIDSMLPVQHCGAGVRNGWIVRSHFAVGPDRAFYLTVVQNTAVHSTLQQYSWNAPEREDPLVTKSFLDYCSR